MPLQTQINLGIIATLTGTAADFGTPSFPINYQKGFTWSTGVGLNQADMIWSDQRTLTTGAAEDIDLAGSLTSHLGGTLTLARVKLVWIFAASTNTTTITVSRPAANGVPVFAAASDAIAALPAGGFILLGFPSAAGVAVTGGTGDLITITNSAGASGVYDIIVAGGLT